MADNSAQSRGCSMGNPLGGEGSDFKMKVKKNISIINLFLMPHFLLT